MNRSKRNERNSKTIKLYDIFTSLYYCYIHLLVFASETTMNN